MNIFKKKTKETAKLVPDTKAQENYTVVTETIEDADGVRTVTKKCTTSSVSGGKDVTKIFEDMKVGEGSIMTRKVVYSSTSGKTEVFKKQIESTTNEVKQLQGLKKIEAAPVTEELLSQKIKSDPKTEKKTPTKTSSSVKPGKFEEDCLKSHNAYRAKHGVPSLKLSKQLCEYSKEWADELARTDSFRHRQQKKYGENIYTKWTSDPNYMITGEEAVDSWYSEIKDHTFGREPTCLKSGHFTQVIWRESRELGVAWAKSKSGKFLVVANYDPAGNFVGKFTENVPPPKK